MKKEIPAGLIVIVAIAAIAMFAVTPSMSTSFEIDGKQTSDELELLFLGSGDDDYQQYKYVSYKIEKSMIYASAGGAEVYEAGFGGDFLNWLRDLFSGWLNDAIVDVNEAFPIDDVNPEDTNPDAVLEDIGKIVEDEKAGEPGPPPVAREATGEYAGPMGLIIDGELTEDEESMLDAMGVGEIVYDVAERVVSYKTNIRCVKSSHIAFLKDPNGQYSLYYHENVDPSATKNRLLGISSPSDYPRIGVSIENKVCGLLETKSAHAMGIDALPLSNKYEIDRAYSADRTVLELRIKGLSPDAIKSDVLEGDGTEIMLDTAGGTARINIDEIPVIKRVLIK